MNILELAAKISLDTTELDEGLEGVTSKIASVGSKIGTAAVAVTGAAAAGVTAITKLAVDGYADYEQLVGGVETLFGAGGQSIEEYAESMGSSVSAVEDEYNSLMDAQNTVMQNAANAFQTAGLSANEYMEQATSVAAALTNALGGDTEAAADMVDVAITDMADNANKMGTDMEAIQNAYNGFSKQNYTMLDNLKLGYGGTEAEMKRLIADASQMTSVQKELGVTVDSSSLSFDNIVAAIHVMQTSMGIAGTTAKEASTTIQGSFSMMKSAWSNLVTGMATDGADIKSLVGNLVDSATTYAGNVVPVIGQALEGLGTAITEIAPVLIAKIPELISQLLPKFISATATMVKSIVSALPSILSSITQALPSLLMNVFTSSLNAVNDVVGGIIPVKKITSSITALEKPLSKMVSVWKNTFDKIKSVACTAFDAVKNIISGIDFSKVSDVIGKVANKISSFYSTINKVRSQIFDVVKDIISQIDFNSIEKRATKVFNKVKKVLKQIPFEETFEKAKDFASDAFDKIKDFIEDINFRAIQRKAEKVFDKITETISNIPFKEIFEKAKDVVSNAFDNIKEFVSNIDFEEIQEKAKTVFNAVTDFIKSIPFKEIFEKAVPIVQSAFSKILSVVSTVVKNIANFMANIDVDAIADKISSVVGAIKEVLSRIDFEQVWENIKSVLSTVVDVVSSVVTEVYSLLAPIVTNVISLLQQVVTQIIWFVDQATTSGTAVNTVIQGIQQVFSFVFELISGVVTSFAEVFASQAERVSSDTSGLISFIQGVYGVLTTIFNGIITFIAWIVEEANTDGTIINAAVTQIRDTITAVVEIITGVITTLMYLVTGDFANAWESLKNAIKAVWDGIVTCLTDEFNSIKTVCTTGINAAANALSPVLNSIKNWFENTFESAKNTVKGAIEKIKSFFNFEWHLPSLKLPHVTISGSFSLTPPSVPTFGVEWYKKATDQPYMLDSATIFGMAGGSYLGGGEAGSEMIYGKDALMNDIKSATNGDEQMNLLSNIYTLLSSMSQQINNQQIVLDSGALVGNIAPKMNKELGRITSLGVIL